MSLKIVSILFPYTDNPSQKKQRPALLLTKPRGKHNQVVLAYITSKTRDDISVDTDIILDENEKHFKNTNLSKRSIIKLHNLTTVNKDDIIGEVGEIPESVTKEVRSKLKVLFGL